MYQLSKSEYMQLLVWEAYWEPYARKFEKQKGEEVSNKN